MTNKKDGYRAAAKLVVHHSDGFSIQQRQDIDEWLDKQAALIKELPNNLGTTYTATFYVPDDGVKR